MCKLISIAIIAVFIGTSIFPASRPGADTAAADARVRKVIDSHRDSWGGMNVPEADGQALHDIVIQNKYKNALEIGTSNGYSGLWIAWALSKTGGKLITIEIDPGRHKEALAYFREAGLDKYVDARLGDAHELVPSLPGPFDFVFCDADKEWYENYLKAALPKIPVGGCFAAHNVSDYSAWGGRRRGGYGRGAGGSFLEFARSLPNLDTKVLNIPGSGGLSVSYVKAEK
ncbi:MAG: putative O-methyltransferase [Acidobacteria bacterium]|nr:putative O-methyltransferase [Acidobacteriota bacterium]